MTDAGFFRGTSAEQDNRFSDKEKKLLKQMKFGDNLSRKVDMSKVKLDVIKPWIAQKITDILGMEDDVVVEFVFNQLEAEKSPDPRKMQINLTGFLNGRNARNFMSDLWELLLSAQDSVSGIPARFLEQKKEEIKKRMEEQERMQESMKKQSDKGKDRDDGKDRKRKRSRSRDRSHRDRERRSDRDKDRDRERRSEKESKKSASRSPRRVTPTEKLDTRGEGKEETNNHREEEGSEYSRKRDRDALNSQSSRSKEETEGGHAEHEMPSRSPSPNHKGRSSRLSPPAEGPPSSPPHGHSSPDRKSSADEDVSEPGKERH